MPIDYSKYPPNWKAEIVPRILERAKDCCEVCSIPNKAMTVSIPLRIQDTDGRYKIKRFWCSNIADAIRMKPFASGGNDKNVVVVLTIAHLDHDETNHDVQDDRLKAMCQWCHLNYDSKEKYRRACEKSQQLPLVGDRQ